MNPERDAKLVDALRIPIARHPAISLMTKLTSNFIKQPKETSVTFIVNILTARYVIVHPQPLKIAVSVCRSA
jgi:hypothetical protein